MLTGGGHYSLLVRGAEQCDGMYVSVLKQQPLVNAVLQQPPAVSTTSYKRSVLHDGQLVQI